MAEVQILNDTFTRANTVVGGAGTTTGAGNNWTDAAGSQWNIASNKLTSANVNNVYRNWLLRPSSEDCADQRMVVRWTHPASTSSPIILLRANPTTYDAYALTYVSGNQRNVINKYNGSAQTTTVLVQGAASGTTLTVGAQYVMDARVVGTTLTVSTYVAANFPAGAAIQTTSITDASIATGSFGLSHSFTTSHDQVTTYNESAPASTAATFTGPTGGLVNVASTAFTIALSPGGSVPGTDPTTFTPGDGGGGGAFSPTTLALGASAQQGTFTYTPTTSGIKTLSVTNNGGLTNPSALSYTASAGALTLGAVTTTTVAPTSITLACTASGGTGTLTYQWYRSTTADLTPGAGNLLAGQTALALADTGLTPNTLYFYKLRVTDSLAVTATTGQYAVSTTADTTALKLGFIGDSISIYTPTEASTTGGTVNPPVVLASSLSIIAGVREVTVVNRAVAGQTSAQWLPGTAQYIAAKAAFIAAGVDTVFIMVGANDGKNTVATPAPTYLANVSATANDLVSSGIRVILNWPTYTVPGSFADDFSAASTARIQGYAAQLYSLINGVTILKGDTLAYSYFATHQNELVDGVHPKVTGVHSLARLWLQASAAHLVPLGPMFVNVAGKAVPLTPYQG